MAKNSIFSLFENCFFHPNFKKPVSEKWLEQYTSPFHFLLPDMSTLFWRKMSILDLLIKKLQHFLLTKVENHSAALDASPVIS